MENLWIVFAIAFGVAALLLILAGVHQRSLMKAYENASSCVKELTDSNARLSLMVSDENRPEVTAFPEKTTLGEYHLKFYLNASHYIISNGQRSKVHPHTWEFSLEIETKRELFLPFSAYEEAIDKYLATYQNKVMNEIQPFDSVIPTVENITDYLAGDFAKVVADVGGRLIAVEAGETPTRSYRIRL